MKESPRVDGGGHEESVDALDTVTFIPSPPPHQEHFSRERRQAEREWRQLWRPFTVERRPQWRTSTKA
jgi:hypothetical protein